VDYIEGFLSHYKRLVSQIAKNADAKISKLTLVDEPSDKLLHYNGESNKYDYPFVYKQFEKVAKDFPEKYAVQFKNSKLSYAELDSYSNQLANYLLNENIKKETRVGVFVERSIDMIVSILAVMKAGCVYVPIDTVYPEERIAAIIHDAEIGTVISHSKHCDRLKEIVTNIICLDREKEKINRAPDENPNIKLDKLNLAYSIYTSGSTGKPKGVMLTHRGLSNLVANQTKIFGITNESKILQLASLSFDASVSEIFTSLVNGATLHLVSQDVLLSGNALINEINERKISVATIPPSLLAVIPYDKLSNLKTLVSAGELCTKDVVQKWRNGRKFVNAYGPTEVTVCATTYNIQAENEEETVAIGTSIDGISSYILDENLNPVPKYISGELFVSGIGLARGYNNSPSQTAERFLPNPFSKIPGERLYKTGDLVKLRDDGNIEFLARIDDQVKFRGFRIELAEIQSVLERHPNIIKAELILRKVKNENKLVAYYVSKNKKEIEKHLLREFVISHLPEYMLPSLFINLDEIPLTNNGKVNKKALAKIELKDEVKSKFEKPQSSIEKDIVKIWEEVLNIDNISTNDNFFELGGHSLNVIQVQTKIKEKFNKELTVVDLFKYPTVKLFANYLSNGANIEEQIKEVQERVDKRKNLLAQQKAKMRNRRNQN
jgi:amino acid adenylation domain-containing protein